MDICAANNQFAVDALRELSGAAEGQNIVLSPLSLITALALVFLGSKGDTAAQIGKTMHFSDVKDVHVGCKNLLNMINKNGKGQILTIANKLFGQKTFEFLPTFLEDSMGLYGAGLEQLDFYNDPENSRKYINNWISQQTNGKIKEMLPELSVTPNTALVVINTLYFSANWTKQFSERRTYKAPFTLLSKEKVTVDMMTIVNAFRVKHIKKPGLKVIDLPYGSQDFSMIIIIPTNQDNFEQVRKEISPEKLESWLHTTDTDTATVAIHVPKFRTEKNLSLKKMLNLMGVTDAFNPIKANFSGMTAQGNMCISDVYHQTSLEMNEKGTEAASSAGVVMTLRSTPNCAAVNDMSTIEAITFGNNWFTAELSKQMNGDHNGVVSPLSIFLALAVMCLGAEGTTEAQLKQVLHLNNCKEIQIGINDLLSALQINNEYILDIENTLFVEQNTNVSQSFINASNLWYYSQLKNADFKTNPEKTWEEIISSLRNKSKGAFENVPEQLISNKTKALVFNTANLLANWTQQFPKMKTEKEHFTLNNNKTIPIELMSVEGNFNLRNIDDDQLSIIELPYEKSKDLCMYVILPDKGNDLQKVLQGIDYEKLAYWTNPQHMKKTFTNVYIPHFETDSVYSMKGILSRLGMPDMFEGTKANFPRISNDGFFVSDVISSATMKANEDGTSEQSNMEDEYRFLTLRLPQATFKADRPFFYIIQHKPTTCFLFYGSFSGKDRGEH